MLYSALSNTCILCSRKGIQTPYAGLSYIRPCFVGDTASECILYLGVYADQQRKYIIDPLGWGGTQGIIGSKADPSQAKAATSLYLQTPPLNAPPLHAGNSSLLYVGARIEVRQHGLASSSWESLYVAFTPGLYITNLTSWPLVIEFSPREPPYIMHQARTLLNSGKF